MSWFFIALIAPVLWSISNHLDKYLVSRYASVEGGIGGIITNSALFPILFLPIIVLIYPFVFQIAPAHCLVLILAGVINITAILFYLYAINREEASVAAPFFQIIPVFGYIFGYFIFGEILTSHQIIASLLIIMGAFILSIELREQQKSRFKKRVVLLMLASSLCYALYFVLFKVAAIEENFWASMFWEEVGMIAAGLVLFIFVRNYRQDFFRLVKGYTAKFFSVFALNEVVYVTGSFFFNFSLLLAPVALVMLVNSYQPAFVFLIGTLLTLFLPRIAKEEIRGRYLVQKIIGIVIITIGSMLLYL